MSKIKNANLSICTIELVRKERAMDGQTNIAELKNCFSILDSSSAGRYMVATKDISALDLILKEEAAVLGPKLHHKPVCLECFEEVKLDTFVACKMCGLPFCSVLCRQAGVIRPVECEYVARCKEKVGKESE